MTVGMVTRILELMGAGVQVAVVPAEAMLMVVDTIVALVEVVAEDEAGCRGAGSLEGLALTPAWFPSNVSRVVCRALYTASSTIICRLLPG